MLGIEHTVIESVEVEAQGEAETVVARVRPTRSRPVRGRRPCTARSTCPNVLIDPDTALGQPGHARAAPARPRF